MRQQLSRKCLNFVCALLRSFFLLFVSVFIIYSYAHWMRSPIQTYIHHSKYICMPTKHETIHSASTFYHGRPVWFNSDGHLDFMLISSRQILIIHMALGSPYMETYVLIPKSPFCDYWLGSFISHYSLRKYSGGHLGL